MFHLQCCSLLQGTQNCDLNFFTEIWSGSKKICYYELYCNHLRESLGHILHLRVITILIHTHTQYCTYMLCCLQLSWFAASCDPSYPGSGPLAVDKKWKYTLMVIIGQAWVSPTLLCVDARGDSTQYEQPAELYTVQTELHIKYCPVPFHLLHRGTMSNSETLSNADRGGRKGWPPRLWMKELPHYAIYALLTRSRLPHNVLHSPYIIMLMQHQLW